MGYSSEAIHLNAKASAGNRRQLIFNEDGEVLADGGVASASFAAVRVKQLNSRATYEDS